MGGFGSGRPSGGGKVCVESLRRLDVRRLARAGYLDSGVTGTWGWSSDGQTTATIGVTVQDDRVTLAYSTSGKSMRYDVLIDRTPCTFGGTRVWWRCPAAGCGRRVAVLFLGGAVFACRHCYRLAYQSQRETPGDRATRRADKIRDRLGWQAGILNGNGGKPKWMRWPTYARLVAQHDQSASQALAVWGEWIEVTEKRLKAMRR